MYIIRRTRDRRPIAGIFMPITTKTMALRTLAQWQHNYPTEDFHIDFHIEEIEVDNV
jgi:hypothetical protein|tara:strand:- start:433 stop:603 length:171 start_codon:yes stop_codon:yes gene_type:complete